MCMHTRTHIHTHTHTHTHGKQRADTFYEGFLDSADDVSFDRKLEIVKKKWCDLDPLKSDKFHEWFVCYKSSIVKETMLKLVREEAAVGSPPEQFSTNPVNAVLKAKVDYKHNELPAFVRKLGELVKDKKNKQTEFELAVINQGKFRIQSAY